MTKKLFLLLVPLLLGAVLFGLRERTKIVSAEISRIYSEKPMHCRLAVNEARQLYKALNQDADKPNFPGIISNGSYWYKITFYNSNGVFSNFLVDLEFGEVQPQNKQHYIHYMMSESPFDAVKKQISLCGRRN